MTYVKKLLGITVIILSLSVGFTGCESPAGESDTGTLSVLLTDAPFPSDLVEEVNVTIDSIVVQRKGDGNDDPFITVTNAPQSFDLMGLRNGELANLAELEVPTGVYNSVRLYIGDASILLINGDTPPITFPSASESGLKLLIKPPLDIIAGTTTELLFDFDISRSFKAQGNMSAPETITGFHFSPVIRSENKATTGGIKGIVSDTSSTELPNIEVWVEQDTVVSTAFTDSTGFYAMVGLPAATYAVKAYAAGYDTVTVSAVVVTAASNTTVDIVLTTP